MKKTFLKSLFIQISFFLFGLGMVMAAAGDLQDLLGNISDDVLFGYDDANKISITSVTATSVVIETPVLTDGLGDTIGSYFVTYGPYPLDDLLNNSRASELISQFKDKLITTTLNTGKLTITLTATGESIDPTKKYYLVIIPKDAYDMHGSMSNEVRFQMSTQTKGDTSDTGTTPPPADNHGAAADMTLANITHVQSGNKLTLKWTAVEGSENVDIFNYNPTSKVYEKLATVPMDDEEYTYTLTRHGEHQVKFLPTDGKEKVYMFVTQGQMDTPPPADDPEIKKVPKVGPKENIMIAIILSVALYALYRRSTRKAK